MTHDVHVNIRAITIYILNLWNLTVKVNNLFKFSSSEIYFGGNIENCLSPIYDITQDKICN